MVSLTDSQGKPRRLGQEPVLRAKDRMAITLPIGSRLAATEVRCRYNPTYGCSVRLQWSRRRPGRAGIRSSSGVGPQWTGAAGRLHDVTSGELDSGEVDAEGRPGDDEVEGLGRRQGPQPQPP